MAATSTRPAAHAPPRPSARSLVTIFSVMILIGAEVFGVALSGGWALAGLLEFGDLVGYGLMGLFSLIGLYLMVKLWHRAIEVESRR